MLFFFRASFCIFKINIFTMSLIIKLHPMQSSFQIILTAGKKVIKDILNLLQLDLTKNMAYDRQTRIIMQKVLSSDSNAIDIGCHKGEVMKQILHYAPNGAHYGFEPIPNLFVKLKNTFKNKVTLFDYALSNQNGRSDFKFVTNAPAFSGIKERSYHISKPVIKTIQVELRKLDDVLPDDARIDFIKIDVEGAEFDVMRGSEKLLRKNKPYIIFEFGLGASEFYGSGPGEMYDFLSNKIGLNISLLKDFISSGKTLEKSELEHYYHSRTEYYFIAHAV